MSGITSQINKILTSIRWRFIIIYASLTAVAFVIITLLSVRITENNLLATKISNISQETGQLSVDIAQDFSTGNANSLYNEALMKSQKLSCRVIFVDKAGVVQIDSFSTMNAMRLDTRETREVLTGSKSDSYGYHRIKNGEDKSFWAMYYASAIIKDSQIIGAVIISESIQDVFDATQETAKNYLMIYTTALIIMAVLSYYLTNHISKPIEELREASLAIAHGDYKARVLPRGKNELTELAKAFNTMSRRLQNIDMQRNQFVSNASHELKTPLASMKILIESLLYQDSDIEPDILKDFLGDVNKELDRLTNLINDLLYITKIDAETDVIEVEEVDITDLVAQISIMLAPIAESKGIEIKLEESGGIIAECNATMIRQAISNLCDNAVKYTKSGGSVTIKTYENNEWVFIAIKDTGVGITREDISHLFERFYRVDKARSRQSGGTGLGLNIAYSIAQIHGGGIKVNSKIGEGSEFCFYIPKVYFRNTNQKEKGNSNETKNKKN